MGDRLVQPLLRGTALEASGESLDEILEIVFQLAEAGEIREATVLRYLLDSPKIWLPGRYYFRHQSGTVYRFLSYSRMQVGSFVHVKGSLAAEIQETAEIVGFEADIAFRQWLRLALENRLLDEITFLETFRTEEFRYSDRVFETIDVNFLEIIAPDGRFRGWYGQLGKFDPLQPPSKLWSFQKE